VKGVSRSFRSLKNGYAAAMADEDIADGLNPSVPMDLGHIEGYTQGTHDHGGCFMWGSDGGYVDMYHDANTN
jgi:hypothetical protein